MKRVILTLTSLAVIGSAGLYAQGMGQGSGDCEHKRAMGMHKMMHKGAKMHRKNFNSPLAQFQKLKKELNLTQEQKQKIRSIMQKRRAKMREIRKQLNTKRYKIKTANFMSSNSFDEKAFKKELAKAQASRMSANSEVREQRVQILTNTFKEIFNILTKEQREKVIELSE